MGSKCKLLIRYVRYIKELADRIHSIENKLESEGAGALSQEDLDRLFSSNTERPRAQSNEDPSRKRPFSSISTGDFTMPAPPRQTPWGSQPRPIQPSAPSTDSYGTPYTASTLAPQPSPIVKLDNTPSKPPMAQMEITMPDVDVTPDIDEVALHK